MTTTTTSQESRAAHQPPVRLRASDVMTGDLATVVITTKVVAIDAQEHLLGTITMGEALGAVALGSAEARS